MVRGGIVEGAHDQGKSRLADLSPEPLDDPGARASARLPEHQAARAQASGLRRGGGEEIGQVRAVGPLGEKIRHERPVSNDRKDGPGPQAAGALSPDHPVIAIRPRVEPPVGPGAVAHRGLHQEAGSLVPEGIETLGDEVSGAGVARRAGELGAGHVPLPDRKQSAGADDAVADLQGARVGETETERNAARFDDLVERVGHRAVDAPAEPPGGGIRGDVADRIEEPLLSLQVKTHGPTGIVADDLSVPDGHGPQPAVRVQRELPVPLFRGHFGAEDTGEEPPDARRIGLDRDADLDAHAEALSQRNRWIGRPSAVRKTVRYQGPGARRAATSSGNRNSSDRSAAANGRPDGLGETATAAPACAGSLGSPSLVTPGAGGGNRSALSSSARPRRP